MPNLFSRLFRPKPRILIFSCTACDNEFAQHRINCKFVPGLGGDRFYCKCPVCGEKCWTHDRSEGGK